MAGGGPICALAALALGLSGAVDEPRDGGHLQVKAVAGVQISVGELTATAEDHHGVTFQSLEPGAHRLEARREGYVAQHALIWVRPGEVTVHRLAPWQRQIANRGRGAIVVQTLPVEATVSAQGLGYEKIAKGDDDLVIPHVPAGRHKLTFCTEYKCIDYRAHLEDGELVRLLVLFEPGEVQDRSEAFRARVDRLTQSCLRIRDADACTAACTLTTRLGQTSPTCRITRVPDLDVVKSRNREATIPASTRRALP